MKKYFLNRKNQWLAGVAFIFTCSFICCWRLVAKNLRIQHLLQHFWLQGSCTRWLVGNVFPYTLSPSQTEFIYLETDWQRLTNVCPLIYKLRESANVLQSVWVSSNQWLEHTGDVTWMLCPVKARHWCHCLVKLLSRFAVGKEEVQCSKS